MLSNLLGMLDLYEITESDSSQAQHILTVVYNIFALTKLLSETLITCTNDDFTE